MSSNDALWSDYELRVAVETYLYILRLQQAGVPYSISEIASFLMGGPLNNRNDASIRYRMRNISDVFKKRGIPTVKAYSPAPQVGAGVRKRISDILDSLLPALPVPPVSSKSPFTDNDLKEKLKEDALRRLEQLDKSLSELETGTAGIGHNHPPEPIEDAPLTPNEISSARADIQTLRAELNNNLPDINNISEKNNKLLQFGLKLAIWAGERATKFSDAAMVSAGTALGIKLTGLMPQIVDAVQAITRFIGHIFI